MKMIYKNLFYNYNQINIQFDLDRNGKGFLILENLK